MENVMLGLAGLVTVVIAASEFATWRISSRQPPARRDAPSAVIVLGYPTRRNGGLHPVQRWRTEIGVRTLKNLDHGWLIFSGAPTKGAAESEAAVMARYAVTVLRVPEDRVRVEPLARSTWENVLYALPFADSAEQIAVASDPVHAEKARRYLARQRPDLVGQVVRAADYQFLERWWLKIVTVADFVRLKASGTFGKPPDFALDDA